MINIYINIAITGTVNVVLSKLIDEINNSELYEKCNNIFLVFNGDKNIINFDLNKDKYIHIDANDNIYKCEFPTLELIWKHSHLNDAKILYIHTKGVTKPNNQNIIDWTDYLSYFNIRKWKDRIKELEESDCTGVNLTGNPNDINENPSTWGYGKAPLHYSGNFWWSKSSHIIKLNNPIEWLPCDNYLKWRIMAEMWLCQIEGNYKNAFSSNINHYIEQYKKESYKYD